MTREETTELLNLLREGLMVLVRDGLINEARADERARNLTVVVMNFIDERDESNGGK